MEASFKTHKTTHIPGLPHWLKCENQFPRRRQRRKSTHISELAGEDTLRSENFHRNQMNFRRSYAMRRTDCLLYVGVWKPHIHTHAHTAKTHVHDLMNQPITSVYKLVKLCGSHCGFRSPSKKLLAGGGAFKQWTHVSGAMGSDYSCDPETASFSKEAAQPREKESRVTSFVRG